MATQGNLFGRDDQVTVINPTNRDFGFQWNSKKYVVPAGQIARIPGFMAEHYVKEITNEMMIRAGKEVHLMDDNHRKPYYEKLIKEVVSIASFEEASENPEDVTVLGSDHVEESEERAIAKAAAPRAKGKGKDKIEELPDAAIDEPLDLDSLPDDEVEIEKEKARLKLERDDDDTKASDLDDAFPDA